MLGSARAVARALTAPTANSTRTPLRSPTVEVRRRRQILLLAVVAVQGSRTTVVLEVSATRAPTWAAGAAGGQEGPLPTVVTVPQPTAKTAGRVPPPSRAVARVVTGETAGSTEKPLPPAPAAGEVVVVRVRTPPATASTGKSFLLGDADRRCRRSGQHHPIAW